MKYVLACFWKILRILGTFYTLQDVVWMYTSTKWMYSMRLTVWNQKKVESKKDLITNIEGLRVAIT